MPEPYVRSARFADLKSFAAALGDREFFEDRFERQRKGLGELFLAWLGLQPAGAVYLWLEEAEERPIRWHLPRVPLITHLEVRRDLRNLGVGQALVGAVEHLLVERGHERVALAVRTDNHDAARLYRRLGYRDWGHGVVVCYARAISPDGSVVTEAEPCFVRVKDLVPVTPAPRTEARPIGASYPS
ncbi:GNAT family N-acetyltransferase [Amycolatopsis sp. A133]|uniref:GNAT family N-acetyltransferase n=1 Tax=Amycolatopsis sp. A133 TaxID=3064472 RepID=UPI0027E6E3E5|nr:GNAT family N-acetyltransferase [Amycolatopsis sp. A133]MDQ7806903.1 GNAT family N-acetyltransferase [Amycolatopsis sp. A133]